MKSVNKNGAFTLIEMVMVITIIGILGLVVVPILTKPFSLFTDIQKRSDLVDRAQSALAAIRREIRQAVPNSIRVSGTALEYIPIVFAGRYPLSDTPADVDYLTPRQADSNFSILGNVPNLTGNRLIVNPASTALLYAAMADTIPRIVTPSTAVISTIDNGNQDRVTITPAFQFDPVGNGSPSRRMFASGGAESFVCNGGQLEHFSNYTASIAQPTNPAVAPLSTAVKAVISSTISACQFRYSNGTAQRSALLTIDITVTEGDESVRLIQQVHVENAS